jgi:hypothetical protein
MTTYTNNLRQFSGKNIAIKEVYSSYRAGGIDINGKFQFKNFKYFPKSDKETLTTSDIKDLPKEDNIKNLELREVIWVGKQPSFQKITQKINREFFATYKKVFDVHVYLEEETKVHRYKDVYESTDEVIISGVGAGKIKKLLEDLELDVDVELIDGRDKAGNPAKVFPYDYEDSLISKLKGKFIVMRVRGEGLDSKYSFKSGNEFTLPTAEVFPEDTFYKEEEIDLSSIPF